MKIEVKNQRRRPRPAKKVTAAEMDAQWWAQVGKLHSVLAVLFEHPWSFDITAWLGGKPSIHVRVHAPADDPFCYDPGFAAAVDGADGFMPPGYYFDGTDIDADVRHDGTKERGYYLYPEGQ